MMQQHRPRGSMQHSLWLVAALAVTSEQHTEVDGVIVEVGKVQGSEQNLHGCCCVFSSSPYVLQSLEMSV